MSKLRLILLMLVAACTMGAVMAASASAFELELYLIEGHSIKSGEEEKVKVSSGTASLQGGGLTISCTTVTSEAKLLAEGKSDEKALFTNCTVSEPSGCTVVEPIEVNATDQALLFNGKPADTFSPVSGTTFVTLHFKPGCAFTELPVSGTAQALIVNGGEELTEHELVFNGSSGELLEVAGSKATFKLKSKVKLESGKKFSVHMS